MNANSVYANIRLAIPDAGLIEMNKYLLSLLDELNATGLERIMSITVVLPTGDEGTPETRTATTAHNYYPTAGCLVVPSSLLLIEKVYFGNAMLLSMTTSEFMSTVKPIVSSYFLSDTGEMYLSFVPVAGDVIKIQGRFGGLTVDLLPDNYIPYFSNSIIASLYANEYKNADAYAVYSRKAIEAKRLTRSIRDKVPFMRRNGRLY